MPTSNRDLITRLVDARDALNKMKTAQALGGDNAAVYTYTKTISATVAASGEYRVASKHALVGFSSEIPFCLASVTLKVLIDGTEITSFTTDSYYYLRRYTSSGVGISFTADSDLGFSELQDTPTSVDSTLFQTYWGISISGSSANTRHPLTLATGSTIQVILTVKANQEGTFV